MTWPSTPPVAGLDFDDMVRTRSSALNALEWMVAQYLEEHSPGCYSHQFMSAGELACEVLASQRPSTWELTGDGVRYRAGSFGD